MYKSKDTSIITHDQIAESGAVKDYLQKELEDLVKYLPFVENEIKGFAKRNGDYLKNVRLGFATSKDIKELITVIQQMSQAYSVHEKVQKAKIELTKQEIAQSQINQKNKREEIELLKASAIEIDKTVGTLKRLEAQNTRLRIERSRLIESDKDYQINLKRINETIDKNNEYIKQNSDKLKQQRLNVGNYTASIKEAFEGTGQLGETINKYLSVITLWSEKIEGAVEALFKKKESTDADAAATQADAIAHEAAAVANEEATIAEKSNIVTLEAQTVATEESAAATSGLGKSLKALASNPYVIAIAAIAGATKVIYDNVTAIQANEDEVESWESAIKSFFKNLTLGPGKSFVFAAMQKELTKEALHLEDAELKASSAIAKLRAEAAAAREDASEEGKTTRDKIDLLTEYIDKTKESFDLEIEHAKENAKLKRDFAKAQKAVLGKDSREAEKSAVEAENKVKELERERERSVLRALKQRTTLIKQYNDDVRKLNQQAEKTELENIDTFSENRYELIENNYKKERRLIKLETKQSLDDLIKQQNELGNIDGEGNDRTAEFMKQRLEIINQGNKKQLDLRRKLQEDIFKLNIEQIEINGNAQKQISENNKKEADKQFAITTAQLELQQSEELLALQKKYELKKDFSTNAERKLNEEILKIKIKYLEIEAKRNEDIPGEYQKILKQINDLKLQASNQGVNLDKKDDAERKKLQKKLQDDLTEGVKEGLEKRSQLQQEYDQKDIDFHKRMIDVQAKLAAQGKQNTLAEEQAAATRAEEKKIQDQKRAARVQENITLIKTFSDTLQEGLENKEDFVKSFSKAAAATGLVSAVFAKLFAGSFEKGTEDTGTISDSGVDGKKGRFAIVHDNERILTKEQNKKINGLTNDELVNNALMFEQLYRPIYNSSTSSTTETKSVNHDAVLNQTIERKFDQLQQTIASQPRSQTRLDGLGNWTEEIIERGQRTVIHHIKNSKRRSLRLNG